MQSIAAKNNLAETAFFVLRGGELACEHRGERVIIAGRAVRYLEVTIEI